MLNRASLSWGEHGCQNTSGKVGNMNSSCMLNIYRRKCKLRRMLPADRLLKRIAVLVMARIFTRTLGRAQRVVYAHPEAQWRTFSPHKTQKGTGSLKLKKNSSFTWIICLPPAPKAAPPHGSVVFCWSSHSTSTSLQGQHIFGSGPLVQTGGKPQAERYWGENRVISSGTVG